MPSRETRILILCKTYPTPSARHAETSCIAGMEEDGRLVRLYPVPFRLISDHRQFRKWQWVSARIEKAKRDHRQESHKVFIETINCDAKPLATNKNWQARRESLGKLRIFHDFAELEAARLAEGITLGLLRPSTVLGLDLTSVDAPDWTDAEKAKLLHLQEQGNLFDDSDARSIPMLRKLPFDFHYRYVCNVGGGPKEYRHKIVDWEVGALFWNVRSRHGDRWQSPFLAKLAGELPGRDLMFLMGTIHRFPDQWLIISLIYPPRQQPARTHQPSLL